MGCFQSICGFFLYHNTAVSRLLSRWPFNIVFPTGLLLSTDVQGSVETKLASIPYFRQAREFSKGLLRSRPPVPFLFFFFIKYEYSYLCKCGRLVQVVLPQIEVVELKARRCLELAEKKKDWI